MSLTKHHVKSKRSFSSRGCIDLAKEIKTNSEQFFIRMRKKRKTEWRGRGEVRAQWTKD